MKKTLSLLLAVIMTAMTFTVFPITANAVDVDAAATSDVAPENIYHVSDSQEIHDAVAAINTKGAGEYVIELDEDITADTGFSFSTAGQIVTVIGNGNTLKYTADAIVHVWNGAQVNLGDGKTALILQGGTNNDMPGIVYVNGASSVCNMYDKVTLKNHKGNNHYGGGVTVHNGTFHMHGGTIENCGIDGGSVCFGGGVAVFGGKFIMEDGLINRCYARSDAVDDQDPNRCFTALGGGVFLTGGSEFIMNGGTISNCEATNMGGGVAEVISYTEMRSYGMGNIKSTVIINNGTISGNTAGEGAGIFASGYFYCDDNSLGTLSVPGIGLTDKPGLFINGGTITQNESDDMGGGILLAMLRPNTVAILNAIINGNTAYDGAGIESWGYWTKTDIDGCTITDNRAETKGGGIMLSTNSSGGFTNLKNTTISGNTSGDRGAGIYYDANSQLKISGADIIQNNTYNGTLNNLNIYSKSKPVYVTGDLTGSQIGLSDPTLWDDGKEDYDAEAVSTEYLTSGYKANNPEVHPSEYFTSDHETWIVERTAKTTTTTTDPSSKIRRKYTAKKYTAVLPHPDTAAYASHMNQYVITDITNPNLQGKKITTISDIVSELIYRFNNNPDYKSDRTLGDDTYTYYQYSAKHADSAIPSITLNRQKNANTITLQYSMKQPRGGSITYTASTNIQSSYANSEELVLQITSREGDFSKYTFPGEEEYTQTTIEYVDANPPEKVIYEYDKNSDVIAKYVIEDVGVYEEKQAQITVETGTEDEVRLVRKTKIDYHINNDEIIAASYNDNDDTTDDDIFTDEINAAGTTVTVGETIKEFYTIPEVVPTDTNSCPYIFKGWYYDKENDNDSHPVQFGTDRYAKDIYAHWIKVENVTKDENDPSMLQSGETTYGGFDLAGVQIRKEMRDYNFEDVLKTPGGLRFVTSLSMNVVNQINAIQPNNIEYGYVAAKYEGTGKAWIDYHNGYEKLQYVSVSANGINTTNTTEKDADYFGFAHNVNCTSRAANRQNYEVSLDHQNFGNYLLYSFVVTYEGDDAARKDTNVLARPYIHYTDANGLERVAYSDYRGTSNTLGGCYTSYKYVAERMAPSGN